MVPTSRYCLQSEPHPQPMRSSVIETAQLNYPCEVTLSKHHRYFMRHWRRTLSLQLCDRVRDHLQHDVVIRNEEVPRAEEGFFTYEPATSVVRTVCLETLKRTDEGPIVLLGDERYCLESNRVTIPTAGRRSFGKDCWR